jgi:hypothetical protein
MERFIQRLERLLGPLPGADEVPLYCGLALASALVACALSFYYGVRGETFLGRPLGSDFIGFYAVGQTLNEHQPEFMYDMAHLSALEHQDLPSMPTDQSGAFAYAPAIGELFRPFAKLPYTWAYALWLAFSLAVYAGGLLILFHERFPGRNGWTAFLVSLSAPIFTIETWLAGQVSILTFFFVVLFVHSFERRRFLLAGLVLGLASGKPSLMVIPGAVIVLTASWRMLAGLCTSSALMMLGSLAAAGVAGLRRWIEAVRIYGSLATTGNTILHRTKYVDLNSFFAILLGVNPVSRILAAISVCAVLIYLARACWQTRKGSFDAQRCLWAGALAWTPIANIYVGVYDALILVPAVALIATPSTVHGGAERKMLQAWIIFLWLGSWLSQPAADYLRVQILTIVFAAFGYWALRRAVRETRETSDPAIRALK